MSVAFRNSRYGSLVNELFERIEASQVGDDRREAKFAAFEFMDYSGLLLGVLDFEEPIPQTEARRIVKSALVNTARKDEVTKSGFLGEANRLASEYHSRPEERFALATSVSIKRTAELPRFRTDNHVIIFENELSERFQKESVALVKRASHQCAASYPTTTYLRVFM